jgi:hypothetical protein
LQRAFVIALIDSQEAWGHISGDRWPPGKELDLYCSSGGLQWHMSSSMTNQPLIRDKDAAGWIQHLDPIISSQALMAIPTESLLKLVKDLMAQQKFKHAAAICFQVLSWGVFPDDIKLDCAHTCIDAVQGIENPDDQGYKFLVRACFFLILVEKRQEKRQNIFLPIENVYRSNYKLPRLQQV